MGSCISQSCGNCCHRSSPSQCFGQFGKSNSPSQGSYSPTPSPVEYNNEFLIDNIQNIKKPSTDKLNNGFIMDSSKNKKPSWDKFDGASLIYCSKKHPSDKFESASPTDSTKKTFRDNVDGTTLIHSIEEPSQDKLNNGFLMDSNKNKKLSSDTFDGAFLVNNMKSNYFSMHKATFTNDPSFLSSLLQFGKIDVSEKDKHGNTALHLAVMLGRKECIQLLLDSNAPVDLRNKSGWSSMDEAVSYGDRQTISNLLRNLIRQANAESRNESLNEVAFLKENRDFTMELEWKFSSSVPLLSSMLPSDVFKISKKGASIRLDSTLVHSSKMKLKKGNSTHLSKGDIPQQRASYLLDNNAKVFKIIQHDDFEKKCEDLFRLKFEEKVDSLMSSPIVHEDISTKSITFSRAQSGWLFKVNESKMVGQYMADFYNVNGMSLRKRLRWEHLLDDDSQQIRAATQDDLPVSSIQRRESLMPPHPPQLSWDQYLDKDEPPILGRLLVYKEDLTPYKATIAMSKDIPLNVDMFITILKAIDPHFEHLNKLKDFVGLKLPPGFPVNIKIPVIPTITATVTINDFQWRDNLPDHLFNIPEDYREGKCFTMDDKLY